MGRKLSQRLPGIEFDQSVSYNMLNWAVHADSLTATNGNGYMLDALASVSGGTVSPSGVSFLCQTLDDS